jgi:hypothetical protein
MRVDRSYAWLGALVFLFALWDFFARIHVGRDAALREFGVPAAATVAPARTAQSIQADLTQWVPVLGGVEQPKADPASPEAWDLALAGVFRERRQAFVVIMARPRGAGGAPVRHRLTTGDSLLGYTIARIGADRVVLQGAAGERELRLYPDKAAQP